MINYSFYNVSEESHVFDSLAKSPAQFDQGKIRMSKD